MQKCDLVTDLYGRTFATWTFLTCCLCVICSRNPQNRPIYGLPPVTSQTTPLCLTVATLLSFVAAFVHFITEMLIFETLSLRRAYIPLAISGHINVQSHSYAHSFSCSDLGDVDDRRH